jgi:putative transposase
MNRKIKFSEGEYYHIYNRGVEKREIFMNRSDYDRFVLAMFLSNSKMPVEIRNTLRNIGGLEELCQGGTLAEEFVSNQTLVDIGAWCLMPNHFHILVREKSEGGITIFLKKLSTAYSMYFNKKYDRVGALLQGTFKAEHANHDNHLKYLYSYIHLNPVKLKNPNWKNISLKDVDKTRKYLANYKYSSYLDYLGDDRPENNILNMEVFPEYFESKKDFDGEMIDWLSFDPNQVELI